MTNVCRSNGSQTPSASSSLETSPLAGVIEREASNMRALAARQSSIPTPLRISSQTARIILGQF